MHDLCGNYILSLNKPGTASYGLSSLFSYVSAKLQNALPDFIRTYEFTGFKRESVTRRSFPVSSQSECAYYCSHLVKRCQIVFKIFSVRNERCSGLVVRCLVNNQHFKVRVLCLYTWILVLTIYDYFP